MGFRSLVAKDEHCFRATLNCKYCQTYEYTELRRPKDQTMRHQKLDLLVTRVLIPWAVDLLNS